MKLMCFIHGCNLLAECFVQFMCYSIVSSEFFVCTIANRYMQTVFYAGVSDDLFSVEVCHNGFFCGLHENLPYIDGSVACFDYCSTTTWSISVVDEILSKLGYERDERMQIYWCMPSKELDDGLVPIVTHADTKNGECSQVCEDIGSNY